MFCTSRTSRSSSSTDLDGVFDRPVAQVRGPEVHDVDEEKTLIREQPAHARQRAGDVQQVIDRLADDDDVEAAAAEVVFFDEPRDRLDAEAPRLLDLERRRIDQRGVQFELVGEMMRHHAGRSADVEQRPPVRLRDEGPDELGALGGVLELLVLDRVLVDQAAVERADERTIDAVVEAAVGLRGHSRVEKHEPAAAARVRLRGIPVAIAVRQRDKLRRAAQVAGGQRQLRLRRIVVVERGNPRVPIRRYGDGQYVSLFSIFSSAPARQSAMRAPALPSP